MTTDLEQRITQLEQQLNKQRSPYSNRWRRPKKVVIWLSAITLLAGLSAGLYKWSPWTQSAVALPSSVISQANFTVYFFDKSIPHDFILDKKSVVYNNGILNATIFNANGKVFIVQQAAPKQQIKLDNLPGFKPLGSTLGQSVIGNLDGKQTVILMTDTTLVNVTADPKITAPVVTELMRKLTPVNR